MDKRVLVHVAQEAGDVAAEAYGVMRFISIALSPTWLNEEKRLLGQGLPLRSRVRAC